MEAGLRKLLALLSGGKGLLPHVSPHSVAMRVKITRVWKDLAARSRM
jgi:hypothetical protein